MLSLKEIYKSIDNLNDTLDSKELDFLLLKYMKWLCYYEDFNKVEELAAKLSPWNISAWEKVIRDFKNDPSSFGEEYLKFAKEQKHPKKINSDSIDYIWSMDRFESSKNANDQRKDDSNKNVLKQKGNRKKMKKNLRLKLNRQIFKKNRRSFN